MTARAELETRENWVGTYEFVDSPGQYRMLMETPNEPKGYYWFDVSRGRMPWQWGITSKYEGHLSLREFIEDGYFQLICGDHPWDHEDKQLSEDEPITEEAMARAVKQLLVEINGSD